GVGRSIRIPTWLRCADRPAGDDNAHGHGGIQMSAARSTRSERADRIVDPGFGEGLEDMSTDEIRGRRDEARAELESLSYLRRHMQSWQDMLQAERSARGKPGNFRQPLAEV